jgi:hypothetical protein
VLYLGRYLRFPLPPNNDALALYADDSRFVLRFLYVAKLRTRDQFRRWRQVVRRAVAPDGHGVDGPDEESCAAWRTAMLGAGATERDLDVLAVFLVLLVIAETPRGSRRRQFELIAKHIACASMRVGFGEGGEVLGIEFPDQRPADPLAIH